MSSLPPTEETSPADGEHGRRGPGLASWWRSERAFAAAVTAVFALVALAKILVHEPWRDEWGPWGVVLESGSLAELDDNLRYGGHPRLWPILLFALHRVIGRFEAVQVLAALLSVAAVYVVARHAPFPRWARLLFAAGYYPLFEYGSIARPYALALPAAVSAAALVTSAAQRPWLFVSAIAVLAQTTMYGVILAGAMTAAAIAHIAAAGRLRESRVAVAIIACVAAASALISVQQMVPPPDGGFADAWHFGFDRIRLRQVVNAVVSSLLPMQASRLHWWNSHILLGQPALQAGVAAALLVTVTALLRRDRIALTLWLLACGGHLSFAYVKYAGFMRHHGHLFLALLAAFWIAWPRADARRRRLLGGTLALILTVHAIAGIRAVLADVRQPFSGATMAAEAIRRRGLDQHTILGAPAPPAVAVAAALQRPFVLPGTGRTSMYVQWDRRGRGSSPERAARTAREEVARTGADVVLVLNKALAPLPQNTRIVTFTPESIVGDEQFFVYLMQDREGFREPAVPRQR